MIGPAVVVELDDADDLMPLADASRMLALHPTGLQRAVQSHTVASVVRDGTRLVSFADVVAWVREPTTTP